ncbi:hypothetical protein CgunFtcFv8_024660 [Champsocephalus gunnari]|uniref:Ig-like domain-containing protein n=1 Tax=Champsocephalus gunnari TaxID=52237 RepID=A0AAN8DEY1_CHAGU|nr:hypothetical protein CgunFtcFv8_024660 [Champsocephalus gunnari]
MARRYFLTYFTLTSFLVAGQSPEYALQGGGGVLKAGPIQITDLRFEDSGEYELELELNKKLQSFFYQLEVIDKIAKPTISCEIKDDGIGNISGKLLCSAEPGRLQTVKKLEWRSHGSVQPGPEFNISLGGEHNEEEYSCTVSNPRSSGTATFTAKDCYPVKSSSVGLTVGLVSFCILLLLAVLGIVWFCKLRHKACFAKGDPEKQSPVVPKKGMILKKAERSERKYVLPNRESTLRSNQPLRNLNQAISGEDKKKADRSEEERLLHQSESTLPSNQSPHSNQDHNIDDQEADTPQKGSIKKIIRCYEQNNSEHVYGSQRGSKKTACPRSPQPAFSQDQNNLGDEDADREHLEEKIQLGKAPNSEDAEPNPAGVSDVPSEETQSDLEPSVPKQTEKNSVSPPSPTHSGSASSPDLNNLGDEDADQNRENREREIPQGKLTDSEKAGPDPADLSDVLSEESSVPEQTEPEKKDEKAEEMQSAPASAETCSPAHPHEDSTFGHKETKEKNVRESDSSGEEERNESDDSTEDEHSPTLPEHKGLETTLHEQDLKSAEEETHTSQDKKQEVSETVKPVSEDGNKTESVGDCKEPDLYLATSQLSQSPTPSNTFQETPDTAGAQPDQEEEEQQVKSKVQSDKDKGDVVEDKQEVECGRKEEKPGNESLSEDEEEQKKDKVVA